MAKYVNPYTDFGFKKVFGEEASKPQLIDFLNALLPEKHPITEITFKNLENLGETNVDRKAIFDIYCENERGEKFIVELQKAKQNYFKERTVFYATFPIREQAERGEWNYHLKAVYCIGILDFRFQDYATEAERNEVIHRVILKDQHNRVFYDKLQFIYLEMPNFAKQEHELSSRLDQWLYFIKHLADLQTIPQIFEEQVFQEALQKAEIAKFTPSELETYENSLKVYRDLKGVIDTAFEKGIEQGIEQGILLVAKSLKASSVSLEVIAKTTGLSEAEIKAL